MKKNQWSYRNYKQPSSFQGFRAVVSFITLFSVGGLLALALSLIGPIYFYPDSFVARAANKTLETINPQNNSTFANLPSILQSLPQNADFLIPKMKIDKETFIKNEPKTERAPLNETPEPKPSSDTSLLGKIIKDNISPMVTPANQFLFPESIALNGSEAKPEVAIEPKPTPRPQVLSPKVVKVAVSAPKPVEISINPVSKLSRWPVTGNISQYFNYYHHGLDITGKYGTPIYPVQVGIVSGVDNDRYGLGKHVKIDHRNGLSSIYGHMSEIKVSVGQTVNLDTVVGLIGMTGRTTGPHVHLEIYQNGAAVDPNPRLPG